MVRSVFIILILICIVACFSFFNSPSISPAREVKQMYLQQTRLFIKESKALQAAVESGNQKTMQRQFLKTRSAYKKTETIFAYYFQSYINDVNGPPIPYFEEEESDIPVQQPKGMQVMEEIIFADYNSKANKVKLKHEAAELVRITVLLPTINEQISFDDANNFDAFIEELYRITALGITGFDSQTAVNSLVECKEALKGLQGYISVYKNNFDRSMPGKFARLDKLINAAIIYLDKNNDFIAFNRMIFIVNYLDPITKIIGNYKQVNGLHDNQTWPYYSAIRKNNSMFSANAFNTNSFLDDFSTSPGKIELGRKLFFDTQLSSNKKRSCATCHQPGKAFTDGLKTSLALDGHTSLPRNAPTLWNAALQRNLFADSRSPTLESQVMQVLNNALEMQGSAQTISEEITRQPAYETLYQQSFPNTTIDRTAENICNAIACYERTLVSLNSKFDKHFNGRPLLTKQEINGFNLFMGKAKCGTCHFMPLFNGAKPPRYYYIESEVIGVPANNNKNKAKLDADPGRNLATGYPIHKFSFKTSSLRNIALTSPYMHNGVFKTLDEVVDFYNDGGGKGLHIAPPNQSLPFSKLNLSDTEKKDIISFLKTLTDTSGKY